MSVMKSIGRVMGTVGALPHVAGFVVGSLVMGRQRAFGAASERIAKVPGHLGIYVRAVFYQMALLHVGKDVYFGFMSVFSKAQARIGDRVYIGRFCSIGWVDIGDDVMLADGVQILSGRHQHGHGTANGGAGNPRNPGVRNPGVLRDNPQTFTQVTIGKGAWLGAGAIIMADVGEGAIVAAGAVVTKPVPAHVKVAGVPAKALEK